MKRKKTNDFQIDGSPMLQPDAGVAIEYENLIAGDSGRDESGYMHTITVRNDMKRWRFSYAWLTAEEYAYVRSLLRGKTKFTFTFKDETGKTDSVKAYCQKTGVSYWSARRGLYKDMQFDIIEC